MGRAGARDQNQYEYQAERPADDAQQDPDRVHIQCFRRHTDGARAGLAHCMQAHGVTVQVDKKGAVRDLGSLRLTPLPTGCTDRKTDQHVDYISAMLRHRVR